MIPFNAFSDFFYVTPQFLLFIMNLFLLCVIFFFHFVQGKYDTLTKLQTISVWEPFHVLGLVVVPGKVKTHNDVIYDVFFQKKCFVVRSAHRLCFLRAFLNSKFYTYSRASVRIDVTSVQNRYFFVTFFFSVWL